MKSEDKKTQSFSHRFRLHRREVAQDLFPSTALFVSGILAMPALLFNPSTALRIGQFLLFWIFAWSIGKRTSLLNALIVSASIVAFNLIVPYGRVLASIGNFRITQGALLAGIEKAVTVEGLIMLSKATVRSDLRLPGRFGALIGESFRYFELIMERKGGIDRKDPIGGVDRLLVELSAPIQGGTEESAEPLPGRTEAVSRLSPQKHAPLGRAILVAAIALTWGLFLLPVVFR